ncbi:cytochrome c oxidase subunit II [candidate division BRC1 bacterium HGW-BRC1-1]|jgi:cytochrome c oxidase subunit 2|nr:MAG: cytochrome c oxidase subunit II [candidate division BRC1 bacterium HGW-BRC1-1]
MNSLLTKFTLGFSATAVSFPWLPEQSSTYAPGIDGLFYLILGISLFFIVLVHVLIVVFVWRYRQRQGRRAFYTSGNRRLEALWFSIPAVILVVLVILSQSTWSRIKTAAVWPAEALTVEVLAEQYAWNFRYAGPDGKFGALDPALMDPYNPWGRVEDDPDGADDVMTINTMAIPVNEPVRVLLRSKDVIHSFFLPDFRYKHDAVPGMTMEFHLEATRPGDFPLACAEFCGLGHYRMKGTLHVMPRAEFDAWLTEQAEEGQP